MTRGVDAACPNRLCQPSEISSTTLDFEYGSLADVNGRLNLSVGLQGQTEVLLDGLDPVSDLVRHVPPLRGFCSRFQNCPTAPVVGYVLSSLAGLVRSI